MYMYAAKGRCHLWSIRLLAALTVITATDVDNQCEAIRRATAEQDEMM